MPRSPLEAIRAVLAIDTLPDGRPMPAHLSHALLVLATYWPHIRPTQDRLARDMKVNRRGVNKRLAELERAGVIARLPGSPGRATVYRILFKAPPPDEPSELDKL